jgi:hypothetical protein
VGHAVAAVTIATTRDPVAIPNRDKGDPEGPKITTALLPQAQTGEYGFEQRKVHAVLVVSRERREEGFAAALVVWLLPVCRIEVEVEPPEVSKH